MRTRLALSLFVVLFIAVSGVWGGAVPVTIVDPSFESPACATIGTTCAPGAGWVVTGGANQFYPILGGTTGVWESLPDGTQVGYTNSGSLTQTLSTDVAADTTYTLSVWVSERVTGTFNPTVELTAAGNPVITMTTATTGLPMPVETSDGIVSYTWVDWVGTWTSGTGGLVGTPLGISLSSNTQQSDYDNITLTANALTPSPEPAVFALVGAGLLGLLARRRFAR